MPELHGLAVHVTDSSGNRLEEWGVQRLQKHNKISSYIKSKTDTSFKIALQPNIPNISSNDATRRYRNVSRTKRSEYPGFSETDDEWDDVNDGALNHSHTPKASSSRGSKSKVSWKHRLRGSRDESSREYRYSDRELGAERKALSSPVPSWPDRYKSPPPFSLLASLFLDGRQKPECRAIVYLDPSDKDYSNPSGMVQMKGRTVQGKDGTLREHAWVFKEVGIETAFDKMLLAGSQLESEWIDSQDEETVISAMGLTELGAEGDIEKEEKAKVGQIVIKIEKVLLGRRYTDNSYYARHQEGDEDDVTMDGMRNEITHTAGFAHGRNMPPRPIARIEYSRCDDNESAFATFQFFYRSQESLEKFNFPGFPRAIKPQPRNRRHLEISMASLTPLSISHPQQAFPNPAKRKLTPFEDQSKENATEKASKAESISKGKNHDEDHCIKLTDTMPLGKQERLFMTLSSLSTAGGITLGWQKQKKPTHVFGEISEQGEYQLPENRDVNHPRSDSQLHVDTPKSAKTIDPGPILSDSLLSYSNPGARPSSSAVQLSSTPSPPKTSAEASLAPKQSGIYTKGLLALIDSVTKDYRCSAQPSEDADDEEDLSDLEFHNSDNDNAHDALNLDANAWISQDRDDEGLHKQLQKVAIGKRRRGNEDDEEAVRSESAGSEEGEIRDGGASNARVVGAGETMSLGDGKAKRERRNALTDVDEAKKSVLQLPKRLKT